MPDAAPIRSTGSPSPAPDYTAEELSPLASLQPNDADYQMRTPPKGSSLGATGEYLCVTGYDAALNILLRPNVFTVVPGAVSKLLARGETKSACGFGKMLSNWMLFREGEPHTTFRGEAQPVVFPPAARAMLLPIVSEVAVKVMDELDACRKEGVSQSVDLVPSFAVRIPLLFITRLLGAKDEHAGWLRDRSAILTQGLNGISGRTFLSQLETTVTELRSFFGEIIDGASKGDSNVAPFSIPWGLAKSGRLTKEQMADMCIHILFAGYETTAKVLSNGMLTFLRHTEQLDYIRANLETPGVLRKAVNEVLRYDSPVKILPRHAEVDYKLGTFQVRKGQQIAVSLADANRDPRKYKDPHIFNMHRQGEPANLAFGKGDHVCLGKPLALEMIDIAFTTILKRFPTITLDFGTSQPEYGNLVLLKQLLSLPVRLSA